MQPNGTLKILHINTSDISGGAAIAANRLHNAMRKSGIDSKMLVQRRTVFDDDTIIGTSRWDTHVFSKIRGILESRRSGKFPKSLGLFSYFKSGADLSKTQEVKDADIIYLHWVNGGFFNFRSLEKILKLGKPVYWFMHDMFPITGGCHHSFDCSEYERKCCGCIFFGNRKKCYSAKELSEKARILKNYNNISFIAPSNWLYECAKNSVLTKGHSVFHIPNLINLEHFHPIDKRVVRKMVGIPAEKKVIAFGADSALTNPYKGFDYLEKALRILLEKYTIDDVAVLIFGSSFNERMKDKIPFDCVFAGKLHDRYSLLAVYNAADVFVIPSLAENFPNTVVESLACGTPVVGFDVGGIPDLVSEKTGYLAKYKDEKDLARGINEVLEKSEAYADNCISFVNELCGDDSVIEQHRKIWEKNQ